MDLLTLAAICGPWVAPATTLSIVQVESAGQPFAIHDNTDNRSFSPKSLAQAERLAALLIAAGHRLDLGLMQINYNAWFRPIHLSLHQAFNPCLNVAFGTNILSAAFAKESAQHLTAAEALARALSVYNSGDAFHARRYANLVVNAGHAAGAQSTPSLSPRRDSK